MYYVTRSVKHAHNVRSSSGCSFILTDTISTEAASLSARVSVLTHGAYTLNRATKGWPMCSFFLILFALMTPLQETQTGCTTQASSPDCWCSWGPGRDWDPTDRQTDRHTHTHTHIHTHTHTHTHTYRHRNLNIWYNRVRSQQITSRWDPEETTNSIPEFHGLQSLYN